MLPKYAGAFWPFYNANAAFGALVPSSTTEVLAAPTNSNPRAGSDVPLNTSGDVALVASAGPKGTLTDVIDTPESDQISVYVVRPGDTLSDIAHMFNVSVNTIIWANNLKGPKDIRSGQTLIILPISGIKRVVAKGDTLKSLAKAYAADANEIAQFNGLDPATPLAIGSTVIIPGGEIAQTATKKPSVGSGTRSPYTGGSVPAVSGFFINPAPGARVTQGLHGHNGIDFGGARGSGIRAAAAGTVLIARNSGWNGGYGNYVVISHSNGTQTLYSHLTNAIVAPGQTVNQGQTIGYMGSTGKSTGTHLHFEVRGAVNPFAR